jgi:hypothetical protein
MKNIETDTEVSLQACVRLPNLCVDAIDLLAGALVETSLVVEEVVRTAASDPVFDRWENLVMSAAASRSASLPIFLKSPVSTSSEPKTKRRKMWVFCAATCA